MFKAYMTQVQSGRNKGKFHTLTNNKHLRGMWYQHLWLNRTKHPKDPATGAHTNRIEGVWEVKTKQRIKAARGGG
ncbi:hypothetical protein V7S43_013691 [Phytophthora oleae]|uniref:Uncharacterized protein n=1 Tax=Phytophthora oleae TaxID=2107226 RepID=A0ABD3F440_9STRA